MNGFRHSTLKQALRISVASLPFLLAAQHAAAQTAPPATPTGPAATPSDLDSQDIVVTANRRAESIQDVPIAVTAIAPAAVERAQITDTRSFIKLVPTLGFTQGGGSRSSSYFVRGIGTYAGSDSFDTSVGIAQDGVPVSRIFGGMVDIIDVQRVEVLEGPQGLLFGKNASAGLVNIITNNAQLNETAFKGRLSYGNFNEVLANATVNVPLSKDFAVRASGWRFYNDGFIDGPTRKYGKRNTWGGRVKLRWEPTDKLDISLSSEYAGADQDPSIPTIRVFNSNAVGVQAYEASQGTVAGPDNRRTSSVYPAFAKWNRTANFFNVDYKLGGATLTLTSGYNTFRGRENVDQTATSSPVYYVTYYDRTRYDQFTQEVRLTSDNSGPFQYVVGAFYFDLKIHTTLDVLQTGSVPTPAGIRSFIDTTSRQYALFGQATYKLTDNFRVIGGVRMSWDKINTALNRQYTFTPATIIVGLNSPGSAFGPISLTGSTKDEEPSYRAGLQFDATRDVMFYATFSHGFKGAGVDFGPFTTAGQIAANPTVRPEKVNNYEIGLRSELFDRKLTFNATAFYEKFTDFQVNGRLPTALNQNVVQNAGGLVSKGVTVQFDARPVKGLQFNGNVAYVDTYFSDYKNAPCYPGEPTVAAGGTLVPGVCVGNIQTLDGFSASNAPKWVVLLGASYETPVTDRLVGFGTVSYRYQSRVVFNNTRDPNEFQNQYAVVDLTAGVRSEDKRWSFNLYVKNLFDKKFITRTNSQISGAYFVQQNTLDSERRFGGAVSFDF